MKRKQLIRTAAAAAALAVSAPVWAVQQPGRHSGAAEAQPVSQAAVAECAQAQPQVLRTIETANLRLEAARQDNSPPAMRAAIDDLQGALRQVRAQLAACSALQAAASADPHGGHAMPQTEAEPAVAPAPAAPARDPHAGHGATPPPAKEAEGAKQAQPAQVMDPVTGLMVDPATAPKVTYRGQTYYFSSEQAREEFLQNPAKFARKPKP